MSVGSVYAYRLTAVDNAGNESAGSNIVLTQLPSADLMVFAEVDDANPSVLGTVVYTIRATNNGPEPGRNVAVTIVMPPGVTFESSEVDSGDFNGQTWSIGELDSDEENRLEITAGVAQAGPDTLTASIAGTDPTDPAPDNNETSVAIWGRMADLVLLTSVDNPTPPYQGDVTFRVVLRNAGPDSASGIAVRELASPGLLLGQITPSAETTYDNGSETWQIPSLAAGDSATLTVPATVTRLEPDTNRVEIALAEPYDPDPGNNAAESIVAVPMADLLVEASVVNPTPIIGRDVRFTVTVTDLGPGGASDIAIANSLPAGLAFRSAQASPGTSYSEVEGTWTIPDLAANEVVVLTITANVQALPDTCVAYRLRSTPADPNPGNDRAFIALREGAADLAVDKTVGDASPLEGSAITFTITLANTSQDPSYDIVVSDLLPSGLSLTDASPSPGVYDTDTGAWTLATLPGQNTGTLSITAVAERPGSFKNKARISDAAVRDPIAANNADSVIVQVRPAADLAVASEAQPDTVRIGESALFVVRVVNEGPSTATGIVIDAPIPIGMIPIDTTMTAGTTYVNDLWSIPVLPNSSTATLTLTVTSEVEGAFTNLAAVASSDMGDPVPDNNSMTASLRFVAPPVIDPETPPMATEGSEVEMRASITDNTGIAGAALILQTGLPNGLYLHCDGARRRLSISGDDSGRSRSRRGVGCLHSGHRSR